MQPAARIQTSIEILDRVLGAMRQQGLPADRIVSRELRARRYAGAKDRRAVVALIYQALRNLGLLAWATGAEPGKTPQDKPLGQGFSARPLILAALALLHQNTVREICDLATGEKYAPDPLSDDEIHLLDKLSCLPAGRSPPEWARLNVPVWLFAQLERRFGADIGGEMAAFGERAPLDLRVNQLKTTPTEMRLRFENLVALPPILEGLENAIRLAESRAVEQILGYQEGAVEIQDAGAQIAAELVDARPGQKIIDLCAGGGGKSLAFAARMGKEGAIFATDINRRKLGALERRAVRAGTEIITLVLLKEDGQPHDSATVLPLADRVVVDAPCSGSGTIRRNPDSLWRLTPKALRDLQQVQSRLLDQGSALVAPDGRLIYITCSILPCENEDIVQSFLERHRTFRLAPLSATMPEALHPIMRENRALGNFVGSCLQLTPHSHSTDGFFIAVFDRVQ